MIKTFILFAALAGLAPAAPITFIFEGVLPSGTYDGLGFTNEAFVLTIETDTDGVVDESTGRSISGGTATIDFQGASLTVLSPFLTYVNTTFGLVGLSNPSRGADMLVGPFDPVFNTWDMTTSIGPITGPAFLSSVGTPFSIQGGALILNDADTELTFTAIAADSAAVPEPVSLALVGASLILAGTLRVRSSFRK